MLAFRWRHTLISSVMLLAGCGVIYDPPVHYPPVLPIDHPPPPKRNGTIYQAGYEMRLYDDQVARRIGDILTIRLEEATKGEYRAKTKTDKKSLLDYPLPVIFGKPVPALVTETNTEQKLDSEGNSDQSNKLSGTITVSVVQVLANHNLMIQGESWVTINQGQEYVQLTGIVRPEDITPGNVVSSQRVSGAQITYGAKGQAGYATRAGWMFKIFNVIAPY